MTHPILASAAGLLSALAAAAPLSAATVSTAFGNGADAQVSTVSASLGTPTDTGSNSTSMNTRFFYAAAANSNNDIIALRFDLSGYDLSTATSVTLNLTSFRDDASARTVQLLGVTPFATGKDNNGTIAGFNSTNWNEASVKFSTMPGLEWDTTVTNTDTDIDTANTTALASVTFTAAQLDLGSTVSFSGASLATFLQSHTTTNQVTFLLRANALSSGQARFASKEATSLDAGALEALAGAYAPSLTFTAAAMPVPEPATYAALAGMAVLGLTAVRRRRF